MARAVGTGRTDGRGAGPGTSPKSHLVGLLAVLSFGGVVGEKVQFFGGRLGCIDFPNSTTFSVRTRHEEKRESERPGGGGVLGTIYFYFIPSTK